MSPKASPIIHGVQAGLLWLMILVVVIEVFLLWFHADALQSEREISSDLYQKITNI